MKAQQENAYTVDLWKMGKSKEKKKLDASEGLCAGGDKNSSISFNSHTKSQRGK